MILLRFKKQTFIPFRDAVILECVDPGAMAADRVFGNPRRRTRFGSKMMREKKKTQ